MKIINDKIYFQLQDKPNLNKKLIAKHLQEN